MKDKIILNIKSKRTKGLAELQFGTSLYNFVNDLKRIKFKKPFNIIERSRMFETAMQAYSEKYQITADNNDNICKIFFNTDRMSQDDIRLCKIYMNEKEYNIMDIIKQLRILDCNWYNQIDLGNGYSTYLSSEGCLAICSNKYSLEA